MCRNHLWAVIFILFTLWSLLIFLNYSSLILSVRSLANFYVYSVNQQESIIPFESTTTPILSNNNVNITNINSFAADTDDTDDVETGDEDDEDDIISTDIGAAATASIKKDDQDGNNIADSRKIDYQEPLNILDKERVDVALSYLDQDDDAAAAENPPPSHPLEFPSLSSPPPPPPPPPPRSKRRSRRKSRRKGRGRSSKSNKNNPNVIPYQSDQTESTSTTTAINDPTPPPPPPPPPSPPLPPPCNTETQPPDPKLCKDRYIYIQTIPRRYNVDLLRDCSMLDRWMDMCEYVQNSGLGPPITNSNRVFTDYGWYATNQFLLESIFHNRLKKYDCLTTNSSEATAIFVPFYVGLDVAMHLWNSDRNVRDSSSFELIKLLRRKPEWKRWWGRDHFFVGGRITWDFRRSDNGRDKDWGTKFFYLPEARNMTALVIEASPWHKNDFGIPYPTYFHPSSDDQLFQWQDRMRSQKRRFLFSFAGAPRPDRPDSIRNELITQCKSSSRCNMVECNNWRNKCHKPAELMKVFQTSHFCLQPPGDSYTRRSTFDSILAGCIPVFFHPGSAYMQYLWHLPKHYTKYSVFISMYDVRDKKVSVEKVLGRIPGKKVAEMREEVVKLIPRVVYADPRCKMEGVEDAFDYAVKGVLERVGRIKKDMTEGRNDSFGYDERLAWKYEWLGRDRLSDGQWDPYFAGTFEYANRNFSNF